MEMVSVGDAGNLPDVTGYGAVAYTYSIGQYDVTTGQYVAFLNSVATSGDPYGLYNTSMGTSFSTQGITRSGSTGSYSYATYGNPNMPVFDVSWGDAARMVNWLANGQPITGSETAATTEAGTYALNGGTSNAALLAVSRSTTATWFLPNINEWYKAAYYVGGGASSGYWAYPTQSSSMPSNALSPSGTNNANFSAPPYTAPNFGYTYPATGLTPVGSFADTTSAYGAYDMGGDVYQWTETEYGGTWRGLRGGSYADAQGEMYYGSDGSDPPTLVSEDVGFRVASSLTETPEPATFLLFIPVLLVFLLKLGALSRVWK